MQYDFQIIKKNTSVCIFFLIFTFWIFKKTKYAIVCHILYSIVPKNNHIRICKKLRFTFYKPNKKKGVDSEIKSLNFVVGQFLE